MLGHNRVAPEEWTARAAVLDHQDIVMLAREARRCAQYWIAANLEHWPGLIAAHAVGGITTMDGDETFPPTTHFDLRLIFTETSPMLPVSGSPPSILKESFEGMLIEAEICPVADYSSVEQLLGVPERARQLMLDSLLFDPGNHLATLQAGMRARNARKDAPAQPAEAARSRDANQGAQAAPRR